jgi:hypothetical protein
LDEDTGEYFEFLGSFLREMEVYTYVETGYVDSETWPIVCMNLTDQFAITDHDLVNKDVTDTSTDWDNAETYFRYSDDTFDDPQKVTFADNGETVTVYQKTVDPGNLYKRAVSTYLFDNGVYFAKGNYSIEWDSKSSGESNNVGIRLEGISNIDVYTAVFSTSYVHQLLTVEILESGFYNVWGVFFDEYTSSDLDYWAIRNPIIYRSAGLRKWIAVTRDTATNYGTPSGIDYLSLIRVYGDEEYKPFEYYWWWNSSLSTLSNDALRTMVGRRSLKISYPTGSGIDTLTLQEGDSLSADPQFDSKDFLHFWWYIDDISKLDTSFGDFKFGAIYESDPLYYQWNISSLSLSSGWNDVNLKFEDADYFYPVIENSFDLSGTISDDLNFRTNDRDMKSFVLTYRGAGQSFNMYLDDLKIKRNIFDEDVKFGKGLFLNGYDYLDIPVSTVSLEHGTVEFWMKPFFNYYGADIFDSTNSRVMFTIVNNNNDIISLGIESAGWLMPLVGKIQKDMVEFVSDSNAIPPELYINRNDVIHIALVWSNDGSFMDNGDTIRLYINNELVSSSKFTWLLDDTKAAIIKLGGPNTQLAYNFDIWGGGIFENIKIHNYCKTTFNINYEGVEKDLEYTPNDFLQISQDDINFYGVGSAELPFVFEQVPNGDSKTIYIRANKTERFKQSKSSATLIVEWLSSV